MSTRHPLRRTIAAVGAAGLLLAACGAEDEVADEPTTDVGAEDDGTDEADDTGEADPDAEDAGTDEAAGTDAGDADVDLAVAESPLGDHLVDGDGNTLYLFTDDTEGTSTCTDGCLEAWPALTVDGEPSLGDDVDGDLVDTIERDDDGSTQVTYDGMPLYTFASDEGPGEFNGQGSGEVWFVVAPDGNPITDDVDASGPSY